MVTETQERGWRSRIVSRHVEGARDRASERIETVANRVVDAANHLIAERGDTSFTMQDVARATGVSVGTLYSYFAGKDDLLLAALEDRSRAAVGLLTERLANEQDPLARLRLLLRDAIDTGLSDAHRKAALAFAREQARLAEHSPDRLAAALEPLLNLVQRELESAVDAGVIASADTRLDALAVHHLMSSWLHTLLLDGTKQANEILDHMWSFCLRSLTNTSRR